ncbi:hypothetical protein FVQ98_15250 [Ottowia sp. GY511]|uniref:DUF2486 family protein n=1 Tax=Ottowia flava TaxID=2675430 RepID=A0ABW4KVV7_9BURK|nr:hypothetical protein [Ottowia sp. GY511]TXK24958.1 hypothetical protein FVQ98_15250 [Ottowia sp. GY511]
MSEEDQPSEQPSGAEQEVPPQRLVPRNVPTLTEVVGAEVPANTPQAPAPRQASAADALSAQPDAQALLALLGPELDRLISEAIGRVLHEQLLGLNGRVQKTVAEVVRDAIATAHARGAHGEDVRRNP